MATFSDDFSSASGTADVNAPTGIANWTGTFQAGSAGFVSASIQSVAGTISGKVLRLADTGWGAALTMYPTALGNVANNVATEALCGWRTAAGLTASIVWNHGAPKLRTVTTNDARHYSNGIKTVAGVDTFRLWYAQDANEWIAVGAALDVSTPYVHGDWWWTRIQVDAAGNWLWRSWKDGDAEPASWQNAAAQDTTVIGGYCGVGIHRGSGAGAQLDIQWFSMGTGGDAAPSPSTGASISSASTTSPIHGNVCTLTGSGFGAAQGTKQLLVGGIPQSVQSWSDTSIRFAVHRGTNKYGTSVNAEIWDAGALISNSFALSGGLQPPAGWAFVNIDTPNTTASNRLTASPDLATGDQVAYDANGAPPYQAIGTRVTVATDGTFTALPINSFDFEVWSASQWGLAATQTINALVDAFLYSVPEDANSADVRLRDPTTTVAGGVALAGAGSVMFAGSAALTVTVLLSGSAQATSIGVGSLGSPVQLVGNSTARFDGQGTLGTRASMAGAGAANFAGAGALTTAAALAGSAQATSIGAGGATIAAALSGGGVATFAAAGSLTAGNVFTSQATASFAGSGSLSLGAAILAGSGVTAFAGSGALTTSSPLSGAGQAPFFGSGALTTGNPLVGSARVDFSAAGSLTLGASVLAGSGSAAFVGAGTLASTNALVGQGAASFSGSGSLTLGRSQLAGAGQAAFAGVGSLAGVATALTGSARAPFVGSGTMSLQAAVLAGDAIATARGQAALTTRAALQAIADAQFTSSAMLRVQALLAGAGIATFRGGGLFIPDTPPSISTPGFKAEAVRARRSSDVFSQRSGTVIRNRRGNRW